MENKYFTPDIEDIYVGYELVSNLEKLGLGMGRAPLRISKDNISHVLSNIDNYEVPHLTKEQIEAEGWSKAKAPIVAIKHDFYEIPYIKDNFRIDYNFKNNLINILENNGVNLFYGKCKDINTFRKIIKLLGI
jgi:hypothetical protein